MKGKFVKMFALRFVSILLLSGMLALVPATAQASSDDGLVAEWHFDEGSGSVVADSSGNGNDGTIHGASWVNGKYGKALEFDGVDDYISLPDFTSSHNQGTALAWIKHTIPDDTWGHVYGEGYDANNKPYIALGFKGGQMRFSRDVVGGTSNYQGWYDAGANDGIWHFVTWTSDGTTNRFYFDGVEIFFTWQDGKVPAGIWFDDQTTNTNSIGFMNRPDMWGNFNGIIDEICIYNRALTANEIKERYEGEQPVIKPTEEVPVGIDSDGDGWSDEKEREMGTNPYSIDSDADGLNDPEDPNPTVPEKKTPGFEIVFAIVGLLAVAYLLRRSK